MAAMTGVLLASHGGARDAGHHLPPTHTHRAQDSLVSAVLGERPGVGQWISNVSPDQQHQHHLGAGWQCGSCSPAPSQNVALQCQCRDGDPVLACQLEWLGLDMLRGRPSWSLEGEACHRSGCLLWSKCSTPAMPPLHRGSGGSEPLTRPAGSPQPGWAHTNRFSPLLEYCSQPGRLFLP